MSKVSFGEDLCLQYIPDRVGGTGFAGVGGLLSEYRSARWISPGRNFPFKRFYVKHKKFTSTLNSLLSSIDSGIYVYPLGAVSLGFIVGIVGDIVRHPLRNSIIGVGSPLYLKVAAIVCDGIKVVEAKNLFEMLHLLPEVMFLIEGSNLGSEIRRCL